MVRELFPSPTLTAPVTEPPLIVTVSSPVPLVRLPPMAPAPEAMVKELFPPPRLRLSLREPVEPRVAVSLPEPRVMFSRFEKLIEPSVPILVPEIFRPWFAVLVDVRLSIPVPVSSDVGFDPLRLVLLTVTESLSAFRLLIPDELKAVLTSAAVPEIELIAFALTAIVVFPSSVFSSAAVTEELVTVIE